MGFAGFFTLCALLVVSLTACFAQGYVVETETVEVKESSSGIDYLDETVEGNDDDRVSNDYISVFGADGPDVDEEIDLVFQNANASPSNTGGVDDDYGDGVQGAAPVVVEEETVIDEDSSGFEEMNDVEESNKSDWWEASGSTISEDFSEMESAEYDQRRKRLVLNGDLVLRRKRSDENHHRHHYHHEHPNSSEDELNELEEDEEFTLPDDDYDKNEVEKAKLIFYQMFGDDNNDDEE